MATEVAEENWESLSAPIDQTQNPEKALEALYQTTGIWCPCRWQLILFHGIEIAAFETVEKVHAKHSAKDGFLAEAILMATRQIQLSFGFL